MCHKMTILYVDLHDLIETFYSFLIKKSDDAV